MNGPGGIVTNARGGQLGIVLNVREIARTANGDVLTEFEAAEIGSPGKDGLASGPYGGINTGQTRPVHASTLTAAQAREGGISYADYQKARDAANHNGAGGTNDPAKSLSEMNDAERAEVARLQARDSAVKQEEKGHAAAAGQYASAPQYQYTIGPDGKAYAIGGHVDVSIRSHGGAAGDTRSALAALQNAALSPNAPSGADMAAFRQATMLLGATASPSSTNTGTPDSQNDALQQSGEIPAGNGTDQVPSPNTNAVTRQEALEAYGQTGNPADRSDTLSGSDSPFASMTSANPNSRYDRGSFFNSNA
ncbi:putative metalloprotease CJM1_0395 family protein [Thalassospira profundimaris]|uniref:putative metalloprotease CJM1_0395 family protein n=1 Tax=Thalassospira profundimaris TaxID=502049 RepID=UPI000DED3826|nr:putative metalloprotease CJM1_0395 family protein [Thalassospira profundimaris]